MFPDGSPASGGEESLTQAEEVSPDARLVPRPLTEDERRLAWQNSNFFDADGRQEQPIALWILGPSSVGKSTIFAQAASHFGIPLKGDTPIELEDDRRKLNAVMVDGEFMRDSSSVWKEWTKTPHWRSAYPAFKSTINEEKDIMCAEAVRQRKHLVIPHTAVNVHKALREMSKLSTGGYINHVLAVLAPLEDCERRGRVRERSTGKRYEPAEYSLSVDAIWPLIASCNGRFAIVRVWETPGVSCGLDCETLLEGTACSSTEAELDSKCQSVQELKVKACIHEAVFQSTI